MRCKRPTGYHYTLFRRGVQGVSRIFGEDCRSNLKQTWKILNEVIKRRVAKSPYPASFTKNGMEISNPTDVANNFCDYFTNTGPNLASKIRSTNSSPEDFLSSSLS